MRRPSLLDQNRDATPLEVERHLVDLAPGERSIVCRGENGLVERALEPGFEGGVDRGASVETSPLSAPAISTSRIELDAGFGQRSGLVAAQHVHAPRSWIAVSRLTITCSRAMRSAPRASVTETIIGSSSGVRPTASARANRNDSSSGRSNSRLIKQHEQDEQDGDPDHQYAEAADAERECRRRRLLTQYVGDGAEARRPPDGNDQCPRRAADDGAAHEDAVRRLCSGLRRRRAACVLLDRVGFARQQSLVDVEVAGLEEPAVGWHEITGREQDDVAGHQLGGWQFLVATVPQDPDGERNALAQRFRRRLGAVLLHEVDENGEDDDRRDHQEAGTILHQRRNRRGEQQDQDERIGEATEQVENQAPMLRLLQEVRPLSLAARRGVGGG